MLFNIKKKYLKVSAVIHLNYPKHHFIEIYCSGSKRVSETHSIGSIPIISSILLYNNCGDSNSKKVVTV